jgi:hypothetical protein
MSVLTPSCFRNIRIVASTRKPIAPNWRSAVPAPGALMPYAAAAKAIFIRANGEDAYYKATGLVRETNDPKAKFCANLPAPSGAPRRSKS